MSRLFSLLPAIALACFMFTGCENDAGTTPDTGGGTATDTTTDENDHGHSHAEGELIHGPNGGHMVEWKEGHDLHAEWKHYSDNNWIRFYILDEAGKVTKAVKADSFTIKRAVGEEETVFTLDAEKPDEDGKSAIYSLEDQDLVIAMNLGVIVEMKIGDETYTSVIEAHEPHDH